ncbi:discoidin domain-containing receptor 2-like [Panulirus ornatus]|uniref:discoidin domain-containing receptor 2-like n=1 Tax=Panulirus ornatus TaxID=150431 RepID=UPI003A896C21
MKPSHLLLLWCLTVTPASCLHTDQCMAALGMQSGAIPDANITASSHFDAAVNAIFGRAHVEAGGGAWCPRETVYREGTEFLEVDLGAPHVITKAEVQGRFGNGLGREFARQYKLRFWRPSLDRWVTYTDGRGQELLEGNSNTYLAQTSHLSPPVIAARVRFVPYSDHPRTVCMRVELYGCQYSEGLVSYSMLDGDLRGGDTALTDLTYDGLRQDGRLSGGLGQLTDGETGHTNFRVDALGMGRGYEWVGWRNSTRQDKPVEITFKFDTIRNFSAVHIYVNNFFTKDTQVFSHASVLFSIGGDNFDSQSTTEYWYSTDRVFENARNVSIRLHNTVATYVRLQLFFALKWIMISEISFDSVPCRCSLMDEGEGKASSNDKMSGERFVETNTPAFPVQASSALLLGGLICLALICGLLPVALGIKYYRKWLTRKPNQKLTPPVENEVDSKEVLMRMKDLHISVNLSPVSSGYAKAKGKLYGHVAMGEKAAEVYQEPFKRPLPSPGYFTMDHILTPSEASLKCPLPTDTDDSEDYAVPDVGKTPPPPFSEVYSPCAPPPVPSTQPLAALTTVPPVPALPPPPSQEYYTAPLLCQPSNIQGVTGTVIYAVTDVTSLGRERPVPEVPRTNLQVVETLGEGVFGVVYLCELMDAPGVACNLVAMKSLKVDASEDAKDHFRQELRLLSQLDNPNVIKLLGTVDTSEPQSMLLEYMDYGDLYQFLGRHTTESIANEVHRGASGRVKVPQALSYGALVYIMTQVASGMKYLETLNVVHRDLAARNCLVGSGLTIKVSDFGMSRPLYWSDYYRLSESRALLPIRWMAWESILHGRFSTKSDVWAFGVTMWEILTMARQRPYHELSDEGVLENVSHCYHGDGDGMMLLPQPPLCPCHMHDLMTACWRPDDRLRPPFWQIFMFLQRENLRYILDYRD